MSIRSGLLSKIVLSFVSGSLALAAFPGCAAPAKKPADFADDSTPKNGRAKKMIDPVTAIKQFQIPAGFKIDLFAAEPQLLNPVAFSIDDQGRLYIAETYRYRKEVYDIRSHMNMYQEDLASRTVEDRAAMIQKFLGKETYTMTNDSEKIRLLEDRNGDGKADYSAIFAEGFNSTVDGLGAGVLAFHSNIYYTDIPDLWLLRDPGNTGKATSREVLAHGFGIHFSLTGHDLHGLRVGPDGKIYFTCGDRAFHVVTKEGKLLDYPDTGALLRCNPDGSELEVFSYGVRNPQGLAFDDYGNFFSGDNNCDYGDSARLVYFVEGGDSGWRNGYQVSETTPAGLWNAEKLWHLPFPGQAAYIVPPAAHIAQGPAGFNHYPGVGFPANLNDHFFLCDYKGASVNSGIHSFAVQPKGAGYEMVDHKQFLWSILATDIEFAPDGRMFIADWVAHWPVTDKGRIYRFYDPQVVNSPLVLETKKLINEGMQARSLAELSALLSHRDQRVRLAAQFELATRITSRTNGDGSFTAEAAPIIAELLNVATHGTNQLGRIHALWGLGQIGRLNSTTSHALEPIIPLLSDADAEIRAQTAKMLGDCHTSAALARLITGLKDANSRVRFFSAIALGKLKDASAVEPLLVLLRENADADPYLRHAGVMGLLGTANGAALLNAATDKSPAVRMGILLAMRRLKLPDIAGFLQDPEPLIRLEAARAINDESIVGALRDLAACIASPTTNEFFDWRVVNANLRVGEATNAFALADYAMKTNAPTRTRLESLHALETWAHPDDRDRVTGMWRPLPNHPASNAVDAITRCIGPLMNDKLEAIQIAALHATAVLHGPCPDLTGLVENPKNSSALRVAALSTAADLKVPQLHDLVQFALNDADSTLRSEANALLAQTDPPAAVAKLAKVLDDPQASVVDKQVAFGTLQKIKDDSASQLLSLWLDRLSAGAVPNELQFDLLNAADNRTADGIKKKLQAYRKKQPKGEFAGYRETMYGGDAAIGRKIFMERPEAGCTTCHKINGKGGEVGPDLAGIGSRHDREYILESILYPNKQIATGFENVVVKTKDKRIVAGILKSEDEKNLVIAVPEEGEVELVTVAKADVTSRQRGPSAMPEGLGGVLSKRDIRNVIAFLVSTKS